MRNSQSINFSQHSRQLTATAKNFEIHFLGDYEAYPQYKKYPLLEDEFSWIWYYGMQHMGDMAAKETNGTIMRLSFIL